MWHFSEGLTFTWGSKIQIVWKVRKFYSLEVFILGKALYLEEKTFWRAKLEGKVHPLPTLIVNQPTKRRALKHTTWGKDMTPFAFTSLWGEKVWWWGARERRKTWGCEVTSSSNDQNERVVWVDCLLKISEDLSIVTQWNWGNINWCRTLRKA